MLFSNGLVLGKGLPANFESRTAAYKQDFLWSERIKPDAYPAGNPRWHVTAACNVAVFSPLSMLTLFQSFDHPSDEMPTTFFLKRRKVIHSLGATFKVRYSSVGDHPHTGLLADQVGVPGLLRLSIGAPLMPGVPFVPGMALKLFVDGQPSVNTVAMYALDGQGSDQNFFRHDFTTTIKKPKNLLLKAGGAWFSLFVKNPFRVGIRGFTTFERSGRVEQNPSNPHTLVFRPRPIVTSGYQGLMDAYDRPVDFRILLAMMEPQILYDVYVRAADGQETLVGALESEALAVASAYGDDTLFFNHARSEF